MFQRGSGWTEFWVWVGAAETAAWRLKWISLPAMFLVLWFGGKIYRSIRNQPQRFCGLTYARSGLVASATIAFLIALLIGVTVPARLEQRKLAQEATIRARYYTIEAALTEYRQRYHTYPADFKDLRNRIPDTYGTLAEALNQLDSEGYHPYGDFAVVGAERSRDLRGAAVRPASFTPREDIQPSAITFTRFELRMPGEDKILGNEGRLDRTRRRAQALVRRCAGRRRTLGLSRGLAALTTHVVSRSFPSKNRRRSLTYFPTLKNRTHDRRQHHRRRFRPRRQAHARHLHLHVSGSAVRVVTSSQRCAKTAR
jgi:hypothetical protein